MFPDVEHHTIGYVFHVCGLTGLPSQMRLIKFEGIDKIDNMAKYTDTEFDQVADRNSRHSPANQHSARIEED
jgi:hypothetical protein